MTTKFLTVVLSLFLSSAVFANELSERCDAVKGNWQWNGTVNQWQCLNSDGTILEPVVSQQEQNATVTTVVDDSEPLTAKKVFMYAAAPVVIVGGIIYYTVGTIILAPIYIFKKATGQKI